MAQMMNAVDVGTRRQLVFDDALIQSRDGFVATMNPATRHDQPLLLPERPWEEVAIWRWVSVVESGGTFHMWYDAFGWDPTGVFRWIPRLCYATSRDGVKWERPNLGVVEFQGNRDNNIVFEGLGNRNPLWPGKPNFAAVGAVFKDPVAPPSQRFKYIFTDNHYTTKEASQDGGLIYGACSPDGIRWNVMKREPIIPWYGDTMNVCFWDDRIRKYVAYVRWDEGKDFRNGKWGYFDRNFKEELNRVSAWEDNPPQYSSAQHIRHIARAESDDFAEFPKPEKILCADEQDDPNMGLYHTAAVKYPFADNAYFMFPGAFYGEWAMPATIDVQMATSRDGIRFRRWREPFVRLGLEGTFDCRMIDMGVGMLRRGNELLMYYGGRNVDHGQLPNTKPGDGGIGMARIRLDGFVSLDAAASGGTLTTVPLRSNGNQLVVNMDGSAGGTIKVEILDELNKPIEGLSGKEADTLHGNDVNRPVTWGGSKDLSAFQGRAISLRISGKSVKFYAFQFIDSKEQS